MGRVPSANIVLPHGPTSVRYGTSTGRCPLLTLLEQGAGYKLKPKRVFLPGAYVCEVQ